MYAVAINGPDWQKKLNRIAKSSNFK